MSGVPRGLGKEQSSPPWGQRLRLAGRQTPARTSLPHWTEVSQRGHLLPETPTHHPLVHIRPALALQTGLQSLVDIVGCSLGWLQPLLHLGGARGLWILGGYCPPPHGPVLSQSRNHFPLPSSWGPYGPQLGE